MLLCLLVLLQALVQHFAAVGQPERVEGCVLHLSIASLDLDQVGGGSSSSSSSSSSSKGQQQQQQQQQQGAAAGAGPEPPCA